MFIAIVVPVASKQKNVLMASAAALILSCLFTWVPALNQVSPGISIVVCTVAAAALAAWIFPREEDEA